jgi:hypothetical protein
MDSARLTFEVEEAGCASCATRVRDALSAVATVHAVDVRADEDLAAVRVSPSGNLSESEVNRLLGEASAGAGHAYRVKPGTWRREDG